MERQTEVEEVGEAKMTPDDSSPLRPRPNTNGAPKGDIDLAARLREVANSPLVVLRLAEIRRAQAATVRTRCRSKPTAVESPERGG